MGARVAACPSPITLERDSEWFWARWLHAIWLPFVVVLLLEELTLPLLLPLAEILLLLFSMELVLADNVALVLLLDCKHLKPVMRATAVGIKQMTIKMIENVIVMVQNARPYTSPSQSERQSWEHPYTYQPEKVKIIIKYTFCNYSLTLYSPFERVIRFVEL